MDTDFKANLAYVVFGLMASGACIYCMVEPLVQQSNALMRQQLEDPRPGPFDEAFAKTLGVEDFDKYKIKSLEYFDFSINSQDSDNQNWTPQSLGLGFDSNDWNDD